MINIFNLSDTTDYEFLLSQMGSNVIINEASTPIKAIITNTNLDQNYDDKKISSLSSLQRGDIVDYAGQRFMIISEESTKRYNKFKGIMRLLPHTIIINSQCRFYALDCYITVGNLGVTSGQVISIADGTIQVHFSNRIHEFKVKLDDRFFVNGQVFKVTGIDDFSREGIVNLTCEKDSIDTVNDDVVNGVAGGKACKVDITDGDAISVFEGMTYQLIYTSTNGSPVVFRSSDENVATVDTQGLVTGVSIGQATISIENATNAHISDLVTVNVESVPESFSLTIKCTASTPYEIKKNLTKEYYIEVMEGTNIVTGEPVTWELFGDDQVSPTTLAVFTSQSGTGCIVKNNNVTSGYVQLKAYLVSDPSIVAWNRMQMKGLY